MSEPESKPNTSAATNPIDEVPADTPTTQPASDWRQLDPTRAALRRLALFRDLSEAELTPLRASAQLLHFAKHETVFCKGDPADELFVVVSGAVELLSENDALEPAKLDVCGPDELVGESALFDAQPRATSARAREHCEVLSIQRRALEEQAGLTRKLSARIVSVLTQRLARARSELTQLARHDVRRDPVHGLTAELDAIKTLREHTEKRADEVLLRAGQLADASKAEAKTVLGQAGSVVDSVKSQFEALQRSVKYILGPLLALLGVFGVYSFKTLWDKYERFEQAYTEIQAKSATATQLLADSQAKAWRARALVETAGELRAVRDAVGVDRPVETPDSLHRAALNYQAARELVRARYLAFTSAGAQYENFDSDVVFDAVDTYVALVMAGDSESRLLLTMEERSDVMSALVYALASLPDVTDLAKPEHAGVLFDRRVRDMLGFIADDSQPKELKDTVHEIAVRLGQVHGERARTNLVLSFADLASRFEPTRAAGDGRTQLAEEVRAELPAVIAQLQLAKQSHNRWHAAAAMLALAKLSAPASLASLHAQLEQPVAVAYPVAMLLAEDGVDGLQQLTARHGADASSVVAWQTRIEHVLEAYQGEHDCFEERYTRHLLACLRGACPKTTAEDECPNYEKRHSSGG